MCLVAVRTATVHGLHAILNVHPAGLVTLLLLVSQFVVGLCYGTDFAVMLNRGHVSIVMWLSSQAVVLLCAVDIVILQHTSDIHK